MYESVDITLETRNPIREAKGKRAELIQLSISLKLDVQLVSISKGNLVVGTLQI